MTEKVLVLGAGELGIAILDALAKHPKEAALTVLVRQSTLDSTDPDKKKTVQKLRDLGVGFETADMVTASVDELASIFAGYTTVISCNGMGLPSGTQTKLSQAALQAKVTRYFPWQFGMDYDVIGHGSSQDLFDEQLRVRELLRAQRDVKWTIVSTGLFMSFLFVPAFGVVDLEARTVRALGSWDNRITLTTPEDIGRVTAELVLDPRGLSSGVVYTAGDTVSYAQVAELVEARFNTKFTRELWDVDVLKKQMKEDPSVMVKYRDTFAQGKGVAWDKAQTVNYERGLPMTDVRAYLKGISLPGTV